MKKIFSLLIIIVLLSQSVLRADEGMWVLSLIGKNYAKMKELGLKLTAEDIYSINKASLKDAVVIFGGGCTGEIVSGEGLLLTNHHCGYGAIQQHSTVDHDYLEDGFWAKTKSDEIATPGLSVYFLVRIQDVSAIVNAQLNDQMSQADRTAKLTEVFKAIGDTASRKEKSITARVQSFFGGNDFYLMVYQNYKDVRLVGAPPSSIGKFGGDTDNWMWPRHTGDFSVFRVYAAPDGTPAEYSPSNVPMKPRHFLPVSLKGVKKGDFAMTIGYPGNTQRYLTSFGVNELLDVTHPNRIKIRGLRQELMLEDMNADDKVRIQYASKYSGSSNYWKFSIGQSQRLKQLNIADKKRTLEAQFTEWLNADKKRKDKYGTALSTLEQAYKSRKEYSHARQYYQETILRGIEAVGFANQMGMMLENRRDDAKKYSERFYKDFNMLTDKKIAVAMLKLFYNNVDKKYHPAIFSEIEAKEADGFDKYIEKLYSSSIFVDKGKFDQFVENFDKAVLDKDPVYLLAKSVFEKYNQITEEAKPFDTNIQVGERLYIGGIREMQKDKFLYPDANSTTRLSYGVVADYQPRDAVSYDFITTLDGIMEKEDPENPEFIVPEKLSQLYKAKDYGQYGQNGTVVTCFTTTNDITGGNSGSPVINGNGELIGLAFDGNWEAMSGDIVYEPDLQRCICVDIRYVLFVMDKFAGASHLIKEMKIVK